MRVYSRRFETRAAASVMSGALSSTGARSRGARRRREARLASDRLEYARFCGACGRQIAEKKLCTRRQRPRASGALVVFIENGEFAAFRCSSKRRRGEDEATTSDNDGDERRRAATGSGGGRRRRRRAAKKRSLQPPPPPSSSLSSSSSSSSSYRTRSKERTKTMQDGRAGGRRARDERRRRSRRPARTRTAGRQERRSSASARTRKKVRCVRASGLSACKRQRVKKPFFLSSHDKTRRFKFFALLLFSYAQAKQQAKKYCKQAGEWGKKKLERRSVTRRRRFLLEVLHLANVTAADQLAFGSRISATEAFCRLLAAVKGLKFGRRFAFIKPTAATSRSETRRRARPASWRP